MDLRDTLKRLSYDYTVEIRHKTGPARYTETAGQFLEDADLRQIRLEDYVLVTEVHLPAQPEGDSYHLPDTLRAYRPGDIGGLIGAPNDAIYRGPIGDWLTTVEPETEASVASLGGGILAGLGARLGRHVTLQVGRILHRPNLLVVQVGYTATARKGTADNEILEFLNTIDGDFTVANVASGFGSGEALIERIANVEYNPKTKEPISGTEDQRLLIMEGEFSKVLHTANRRGSILGDVIRLIYDGRQLANLTKSKKLISTNHCVSLFGGITPDELLDLFPTLAATSGTGNRYLWVWSNPDKYLPDGGKTIDTGQIISGMTTRLANSTQTYQRTQAARDWWNDRYQQLRASSGVPDTVRGLVNRTTDHVQRVALIYAATEGAEHVDVTHFEAGMAWTDHSISTVTAVLGGLVRNQDATRILAALRAHPGVAAMQSELHDVFARHTTGTAIDAAIKDLQNVGLAHSWKGESDAGRPPMMVMATTPKPPNLSDIQNAKEVQIGEGEKDFFLSQREKQTKKGGKTSFADTPQKPENDQEVVKDSESERSRYGTGTPKKVIRDAKEVSQPTLLSPEEKEENDDKPDPFTAPEKW